MVAHAGRPGDLLATRIAAPFPQRVIVGSVAEVAVTEELRSTLHRSWNVEPELLQATAVAGGVRNGYRDPSRLGIDRWAAMVAAFHAHGGPLLVVDCGTALTLDHVDANGVHRGGLIAPGLGAMRMALERHTRLSQHDVVGSIPEISGFGRDTVTAVTAGCMAAALGLIERTQSYVAAAGKLPCRLLITGGDAEAMLSHLALPWQYMPQLVLDGLSLLAREPI
jgi:type III pantothenate kinase